MSGPYREPGVAMRVRATRCLGCGARCSGERCASCGVECPGEAAPRASEVRADCPRCFVALELSQFSEWDAGFVYCVGCHGCFVPPIDWAVMLDRVAGFGRVPGDELAPVPAAEGLRPGALADRVSCPVCRQRMDRVTVAKSDALPIDICIAHGIWFDASELAIALRAVDRGDDAPIGTREVPARALAKERERIPVPSAEVRPPAVALQRVSETRGVLATVLERLRSLLTSAADA